MSETRHRNANWVIHQDTMTKTISFDGAQLAVLMDIRDELQGIRTRLDCHETLSIPRLLRDIKRNTSRYRCRVRGCRSTLETSRGINQHQRLSHREAA